MHNREITPHQAPIVYIAAAVLRVSLASLDYHAYHLIFADSLMSLADASWRASTAPTAASLRAPSKVSKLISVAKASTRS